MRDWGPMDSMIEMAPKTCPYFRDHPTLGCDGYSDGLKIPTEYEVKKLCRNSGNFKSCPVFKEKENEIRRLT